MKFTAELEIQMSTASAANNLFNSLRQSLRDRHIPVKFSPLVATPGYKVDWSRAPERRYPAYGAEHVLVYTDGGCDSAKSGLGAWAYRVHLPDGEVIQRVEGMTGTTNNRMELRAVIMVLQDQPRHRQMTVFSDSQYVIKGITLWSRNWIANGWRTYDGKQVKNRDLWEEMLVLYLQHTVDFVHVRGHSGHPDNDAVDVLCTAKMIEMHKVILGGGTVPIDVGGPDHA
jgi:ribonuclease HI